MQATGLGGMPLEVVGRLDGGGAADSGYNSHGKDANSRIRAWILRPAPVPGGRPFSRIGPTQAQIPPASSANLGVATANLPELAR